MAIKANLDPVGVIAKVPGLDILIEKMGNAWDNLKEQVGVKVNWTLATEFLTKCLDDLVVYLVEHNIPGEDKKATVLAAISKIYDRVSATVLPWYLRLFAGSIKNFVINILISHSIDWIVAKYNQGSWHPQASTNVLKTWGAE